MYFQTAPFSSTGAMSTPPRPEKMYKASLRTAEAVPTRGLGAELVLFVEWFGDSGGVAVS